MYVVPLPLFGRAGTWVGRVVGRVGRIGRAGGPVGGSRGWPGSVLPQFIRVVHTVALSQAEFIEFWGQGGPQGHSKRWEAELPILFEWFPEPRGQTRLRFRKR
jgi:hypothetical protein